MKDRKPCFSKDAYRLDAKGRRWSVRDWVPGIPSEFIWYLHDPEILKRARRRGVVLYCRVSTGMQDANGNLNDAVASATAELEELGIRAVAEFREVSHSSIDAHRVALRRAIETSRRLGAMIVAPERDRLLRCEFYNGSSRLEIPRVSELIEFSLTTAGTVVATLRHPDAPGRSAQIKRGQAAKDAHGGRPSHKTHGAGWRIRRRTALFPEVMKLLREDLSGVRIAQKLAEGCVWKMPITSQTVWLWSKQR